MKPEPGDESMPTSATATPAPIDSKEGSLALFSVDEEKEAKDLRDLEQEEKKEIILSEAFDLAASPARDPGPLPFPHRNADGADFALLCQTAGSARRAVHVPVPASVPQLCPVVQIQKGAAGHQLDG